MAITKRKYSLSDVDDYWCYYRMILFTCYGFLYILYGGRYSLWVPLLSFWKFVYSMGFCII